MKKEKNSNSSSHAKDFIKLLDSIKPSKNRHEIFNDWLIIVSDSLYNQWKKDDRVENECIKIRKQYNSAELKQLGQLLIITVNALFEKEHDFLGEVFSLGKLTN